MVAELIELSAVIADIYDAAIDPAIWPQTLARICTYVGGFSAALFWHDSAVQNAQALHLFNDDPHYTRLYFEKYVPLDPWFPAASFTEEGVVHVGNDIISRVELEQTRFYKEWMQPQGIVDVTGVNLEKGMTRSSFLAVRTDRTSGMADDGMRDRLTALVPHLQRAVTIGRIFERGQAAERASTAMTATLDHVESAVFLVSASGEIIFANTPAKRLLDEARLVLSHDNILRAVVPKTNDILHDIFASAAKGDARLGVRGIALPLTGKSNESWFVDVLPLTSGRRQGAGGATAVAAVFVRKPSANAPPPLEAIAKAYRLTAGEVRVLDALSKVRGVKAIAKMLGLSQSTVKSHLHNMFRKTGTKQQGELAKLVAGF
jgi:DNA-binding CsgD family transcriptional regulator